MLRFFSYYKSFAIVLLVMSIVIISIFYQILKPREVLPIFQPAQVNEELVDSTIQHVKKYHTIADFSLINQNGKTVTQDTYNNKIYIADFFFTTCQTICPIMTDHMVILQNQLKLDPDVIFLISSIRWLLSPGFILSGL